MTFSMHEVATVVLYRCDGDRCGRTTSVAFHANRTHYVWGKVCTGTWHRLTYQLIADDPLSKED